MLASARFAPNTATRWAFVREFKTRFQMSVSTRVALLAGMNKAERTQDTGMESAGHAKAIGQLGKLRKEVDELDEQRKGRTNCERILNVEIELS